MDSALLSVVYRQARLRLGFYNLATSVGGSDGAENDTTFRCYQWQSPSERLRVHWASESEACACVFFAAPNTRTEVQLYE